MLWSQAQDTLTTKKSEIVNTTVTSPSSTAHFWFTQQSTLAPLCLTSSFRLGSQPHLCGAQSPSRKLAGMEEGTWLKGPNLRCWLPWNSVCLWGQTSATQKKVGQKHFHISSKIDQQHLPPTGYQNGTHGTWNLPLALLSRALNSAGLAFSASSKW